jgi:glucose-1-phosphate adenylyltransferase
VEYSVLSPGVRVKRGAVVRYSVIMTDAVIEPGAMVDRCIVDKNVVVGAEAHLGYGMDYSPNRLGDLSSGLTLVGKNAIIPPNTRIGRNCIISGDITPEDFPDFHLPSGTTVGVIAPL